MDWDRLAADRRTAKRDRLLDRYLREEVHPFSVAEGRRLDDAGLEGGRVRTAEALERIRPIDIDGIDGIAAVLRPTSAGLSSSPDRFAWWWATLTGRRATFVDQEVEPRFRAIHFDDHGALVVASSAADLDRLADLGRRALGLAGVRREDALVSLLPARGDLPFWHVTLGSRRGGVASLHLGDAATAAEVVTYAPSVLVGTAATLRRVAIEAAEGVDDDADGATALDCVRLVLVAERLAGDERVDLAERYPRAAVRAIWSPPGVRAPWAECTAGNLHTWPDTEVVQVADRHGRSTRGAGQIVWTPLGWRGTVVLRLRTGLRGRLLDEPCACGATSPRLELLDGTTYDAVEPDADAEVAAPERRRRRGRPALLATEDEAADDAWSGTAGSEVDAGPQGARRRGRGPTIAADDPDDDAWSNGGDPDFEPAPRGRRSGGRRRGRTASTAGADRSADVVTDAETDVPDEALLADLEVELAEVLDGEASVAAWIAEVGPDRNRSGALAVAVRLAPVGGERATVESDLPRLGRRLAVDRLVVERPSSVRERLDAAGGARVVPGTG